MSQLLMASARGVLAVGFGQCQQLQVGAAVQALVDLQAGGAQAGRGAAVRRWRGAGGAGPAPAGRCRRGHGPGAAPGAGVGGAGAAGRVHPRIRMLPVLPRLWRPLGIAHRAGSVERATRHVLDVLWQQKQV